MMRRTVSDRPLSPGDPGWLATQATAAELAKKVRPVAVGSYEAWHALTEIGAALDSLRDALAGGPTREPPSIGAESADQLRQERTAARLERNAARLECEHWKTIARRIYDEKMAAEREAARFAGPICQNQIGCELPDGHPGPCVATCPRRSLLARAEAAEREATQWEEASEAWAFQFQAAEREAARLKVALEQVRTFARGLDSHHTGFIHIGRMIDAALADQLEHKADGVHELLPLEDEYPYWMHPRRRKQTASREVARLREAAEETVKQHYATANGTIEGKAPLWAALDSLRDALAGVEDTPRCTGSCVFDDDTLAVEDLACPIHGVEAQEAAERAGWDRVEWMKACRASWPHVPSTGVEDAQP